MAEKSALDKALLAFAATKLGGRLFVTVFPAIDRRLMPLTKGRLRIGIRQTVCVVHARGAKSGRPRVTPLLYTPRGEDVVVVASKAGADHHPAWFHNVTAHPDDVEVEIGGVRRPVRARVAEGEERAELWALVNDNYPGFATYQQRAGARQIPVVVLAPR
jgi:deazaflavin-dependent oxidoreductase (nitroreductase family)